MNLNKTKVLVTGAGGFIGSHLSERLARLGADVKCFVKYNSRNDIGLLKFTDKKTLKQMEIIHGDILDRTGLKKAMQEIDVVFHLGALISIPYSYVNPYNVVRVNILGTMNVMSAALESGTKRIIHTSTSEVYGTAQYVPIDEKHPLQGQSPYSASKIGADKLVESFYRSYNLPITTLRPFNTYGPRQSDRAVIPTIICQALSRDKITLGSLLPTRDFTFVDDIVDGFIKTAESSNVEGETIHIGSGDGISIGELTKKILTLTGKDLEIVTEQERVRPEKSEVERLVCSPEKARKLIGWEAKTTLEEGLSKAIHWIENNPSLYSPDFYQI